ncbi:MAG: hypothetical protein RR425_05525 [Erysipelotrichales bacterium]
MIEENTFFEVDNLLSIRMNATNEELQKQLLDAYSFIKDNNLLIVGPKITTTYSIKQAMIPTMDIEILIPINTEFIDTNKYKFKSKLKLINTIKCSHKGNPQKFNDTVMNIQEYIIKNKLTPITSLYTVNINEPTSSDNMDKFHTDLYISINPNIL